MNMIKRLFKRLCCRHVYKWNRNFYGDEIIFRGYKRSLWDCKFCGKRITRDRLGEEGQLWA